MNFVRSRATHDWSYGKRALHFVRKHVKLAEKDDQRHIKLFYRRRETPARLRVLLERRTEPSYESRSMRFDVVYFVRRAMEPHSFAIVCRM